FSSRRRHTRWPRDWSSDVCSSDLHPARFGTPKGELKAGLKSELDASLFDAAFQSLAEEGSLEVRGERVRPGGEPWEPPAAALRRSEERRVGKEGRARWSV